MSLVLSGLDIRGMSTDFQRKDLVVNDTVPYMSIDGIGSAAFTDEGPPPKSLRKTPEQKRVRGSYQDVSGENLQERLI